jgi:nucleotidyltransferase substrate binding protein (TIGR01987 family)
MGANKKMIKKITDYEFVRQLTALPCIDEMWLFGSRARGDESERSDIDIAIVCPRASHNDWLAIQNIIEKADTLLKIDCVNFNLMDRFDPLYNNILTDKKVIYMRATPWKSAFDTLGQAIDRLQEVVEHPDIAHTDYIRDAAIQRFEFTIELFWKVLKKILLHEKLEATTPRDTLSQAYQYQLIDDEAIWLAMLDDRNQTSYAYNEKLAHIIFARIKTYVPVFKASYAMLKEKYKSLLALP